MDIYKIEILFMRKNSMSDPEADGVHHIKSLPWLSVVQSVEGSYTVKLDDSEWYETGESGFFIAPSQVVQNIYHHCNPQTEKIHCRWVFFDVLINERYRLDRLYEFPAVLQEEEKIKMNNCFDELFSARDYCEEMIACYKIIHLLLQVGRQKEYTSRESLTLVLEWIHSRYRENITVEELAAIAHVSPSHLYVMFRNAFGTSPISYLNHYRLAIASDLLRQTDKSVQDIAAEVGIADPFYFSRMFRKIFKTSPREYRKQKG